MVLLEVGGVGQALLAFRLSVRAAHELAGAVVVVGSGMAGGRWAVGAIPAQRWAAWSSCGSAWVLANESPADSFLVHLVFLWRPSAGV